MITTHSASRECLNRYTMRPHYWFSFLWRRPLLLHQAFFRPMTTINSHGYGCIPSLWLSWPRFDFSPRLEMFFSGTLTWLSAHIPFSDRPVVDYSKPLSVTRLDHTVDTLEEGLHQHCSGETVACHVVDASAGQSPKRQSTTRTLSCFARLFDLTQAF